MSESLEELVMQLEQIAPEDHLDEAELLMAALAERERLLVAIASADMASVPSEERSALKARLVAVLERDRAILGQLEELRAEIRKAQEQLISGRAAVRGYGGDTRGSSPPAGVRRVG